jgi:hypothetical protein
MAWEHDLKKLYERDWDKIRADWLSNIPPIEYTGQPPINSINDIIDLDQFYKFAKENQGSYKHEQSSLRSTILWEAIYFAHKSIHICGAAISHLDNGILSWGNSSAYQSSLYSLKSILALLGLSFPRVNNKTLVIDCFPELDKLSSRERKLHVTPTADMKFIIFDNLTHMQYWEIFQRIVRVTNYNLFSRELRDFINSISDRDFVLERNSLHYICNYWPENNDLFKLVFDNNYGVKSDLLNNLTEISVVNRDFSFLLNYILLKLNLELIKDISKYAVLISDEYNLIFQTLSEMRSKRFVSSLS